MSSVQVSQQWNYIQDQKHELKQLHDELAQTKRERDKAREALRDMLSGWKYIRSVHGDLYGVGWDRAQSKAETALEGTK